MVYCLRSVLPLGPNAMDKLQGNDRAKANAKQNPQAGQRCHFPMPPKASFTKIFPGSHR
jgi:hypothetical protein